MRWYLPVVLLFAATAAYADPVSVYLAPVAEGGNDANAGTYTSPVATLQRALNLAAIAPDGGNVVVKPVVHPTPTATYLTKPRGPIRILGSWWPGMENQQPVFDGGTSPPWYWLRAYDFDGPAAMRASVERVTVRHYLNGVEFAGDVRDPRKCVSGNSVVDSTFEDVGWVGDGTALYGTEAVGVFNQCGFVATDNVFRRIRNSSPDTAGWMHAFYVGYGSSNGLYGRNTFETVSGWTWAFRAGANFNRVWGSTYAAVSSPKVGDWYWDKDVAPVECPSFGNVVDTDDVAVYVGDAPARAADLTVPNNGCQPPYRVTTW